MECTVELKTLECRGYPKSVVGRWEIQAEQPNYLVYVLNYQ